MTTIHDLTLALQECPKDLFLMGALADLCEESGEEDLTRHYKTLLLLAQSETPEEASLIYPQFFCTPTHSRTFGPVQQELIASSVDHLRLGEYLRLRTTLGGLVGTELTGEWLTGWLWVLTENSLPSPGRFRPNAPYLGMVRLWDGLSYHWLVYSPTPDLDWGVYALEPYKNGVASAQECLYSNEFGDEVWSVDWRDKEPGLVLVQRGTQ